MRQFGKRFAYKVDDGKDAVKCGAGYRPYKLPRTPRNHEWLPGQQVVYVQCTAAGWMPSSIVGTIEGFDASGRARKAQVRWHSATDIATTISLQRLRPLSLITNAYQGN
jgi:hypothetical protein